MSTEAKPDPWSKPVRYCPYCGSADIHLNVDAGVPNTDRAFWPDSKAPLDEHQCMQCEGRSFWTPGEA